MGFFFPSICKKCIVGPICSKECPEYINGINKRIMISNIICRGLITIALMCALFGGIIEHVLKFFK
jgi:hypothetical protein